MNAVLPRVMLVDDSLVARTVMAEHLRRAGCDVVAQATDPVQAWPLIQQLLPDVLVLDIDMPQLDGLSFLRQLMQHQACRVVMCSSLAVVGRPLAIQALAAGALAVVTKPGAGGCLPAAGRWIEELVAAVLEAAAARVSAVAISAPSRPKLKSPSDKPTHVAAGRILALGLSTGGVQALTQVLRGLAHVPAASLPATVVVQHMPPGFTSSLAQQLQREHPHLRIDEARDGDLAVPGRVLLAPGDHHMRLGAEAPEGWTVALSQEAPVNFHRPAVDVLFESVARHAGAKAIGVLMTGMGSDGAQGLLAMRRAGACTTVQDEATCAVYGMPKAALALRAADTALPLQRVAAWILERAARGVATT